MSELKKRLIHEKDFTNPAFVRGLLFYDIPEKYSKLAYRIRRSVRPFAMPINLSQIGFPWENAPLVEGIALEAREATNGEASVHVIPLTAESEVYVVPMIEEQAKKEFERLCASLSTRIKNVPELIKKAVEGNKIDVNDAMKDERRRRRAIFRDVQQRVDQLYNVGVALRLQDEFKGFAKIAFDVLQTEQKAIADLSNQIKEQKKLKLIG